MKRIIIILGLFSQSCAWTVSAPTLNWCENKCAPYGGIYEITVIGTDAGYVFCKDNVNFRFESKLTSNE